MIEQSSHKGRTKSLAVDTGLFAISNFGSKILLFLLTPLYTSILATSEYGVADLINTTINMVYPVLTLAIADATLRFALDKESDKKAVLSNSLIITLISVAVLCLLKPLIVLIDSSLNDFWICFVFTYALSNISGTFTNFLKGIGKTALFAIQGIVQTIVTIVCNIVFLVVLRVGLYGYLLSIIIGYCIPIILMFLGGKIYNYCFPFRFNKALLKQMLVYSIPMIPTILAWFINTSIDKYMIINISGLSVSGVYSVAHKIPTIITTILNIFISAWQISAIRSQGDADKSKYYTKVYAGLNFVSISGFMITMILTKPVAGFLFKKEFYDAWIFVPALCLAAIFSSFSGFLAAAYRAAKKTTSLFVSVAIGAFVNIVLNYFLINSMGTIGASIATAVSFFVVWISRYFMVQKLVKINIGVLRTVISTMIIVIAAILVVLEIKYAVPAIILLYLVVVFLFRNELKELVSFGKTLIKGKKQK